MINQMAEEFTVKRSHWYRGKGSRLSGLNVTDDDGTIKHCCVGFYALECGMTLHEIGRFTVFNDLGVLAENENWQDQILDKHLAFERENIYHLNDEALENSRERELTRAFANIGIKVNFID